MKICYQEKRFSASSLETDLRRLQWLKSGRPLRVPRAVVTQTGDRLAVLAWWAQEAGVL